jgi:hypothetical protein
MPRTASARSSRFAASAIAQSHSCRCRERQAPALASSLRLLSLSRTHRRADATELVPVRSPSALQLSGKKQVESGCAHAVLAGRRKTNARKQSEHEPGDQHRERARHCHCPPTCCNDKVIGMHVRSASRVRNAFVITRTNRVRAVAQGARCSVRLRATPRWLAHRIAGVQRATRVALALPRLRHTPDATP